MAAIEYGSYYWCVILKGAASNEAESVHLHADDMEIDAQGTLLFRSAGRRAAGSDPEKNHANNGKDRGNGDKPEKTNTGGQEHNEEKGKSEDRKLMTYVAFASGTWIAVYAAKLKDGSAASVEHWNVRDGKPGLMAAVPAGSGAAGYILEE